MDSIPTELKLMMLQLLASSSQLCDLYHLGSLTPSLRLVFKRYEASLLLSALYSSHPTSKSSLPLAIYLGGIPPVTASLPARRKYLTSVTDLDLNLGTRATSSCNAPAPPIHAIQCAFDVLPRMARFINEVQRIHHCGHLASHLRLSDSFDGGRRANEKWAEACYLAVIRFKFCRKIQGKCSTVKDPKFKLGVKKWVEGLETKEGMAEEVGSIIRALELKFPWTCYIHTRDNAVMALRSVLEVGIKVDVKIKKEKEFDGGMI